MNGGQVTVEYIIITGIVSIIFLVAFNFISEERKTTAEDIWSMDGDKTAEAVAHAINTAYLAGDGAEVNVTLPEKLTGGLDYTVTVYRRLVTVEVPSYGREFEWKYVTGGVNGTTDGLTLGKGTVTVENRNGTIYLT